jgi:hypothetical protein
MSTSLLNIMGCSSFNNTQVIDNTKITNEKQIELNKNMDLWKKSAVSNYSYTYGETCCLPQADITVTIKNNVVSKAFYIQNGTTLKLDSLENVITINDRFKLIQDYINSTPEKITVKYNEKLGYPESIFTKIAGKVIGGETKESYIKDFQSL